MRKIWIGIRDLVSFKSKKTQNPISLSIGSTISSDPEEVAETFNDFFASVADKVRSTIPPSNHHFSSFLKNSNPNSIFLQPVSPEEIVKIIRTFSASKSNGPNSIPVKILKLLCDQISVPISRLINRSFETGTFPSLLKTSKVVPVFKNKGSPLEVSNYRPISLLSNIEKIYEKVMYSRVTNFLDSHNLIYSRQFGFRKSHSTLHTLTVIVERIRKCLDNGELACGVFVDLQKAFDTVDHQILISKLDHYGIRGPCKNWFKSYLSDRHQYVSIQNSESSLRPIRHGVPQGSVLGPLLFLIYINDLHKAIRFSETFHFADDTHLLHFAKTVRSLCSKVNADLRTLTTWLNANRISLNASKTEFVIFRSKSKPLTCSPFLKLVGKKIFPISSVKYLGVRLDKHLNWKPHISDIASKLQRANGMLSKLRHYLPLKLLINIYHSIFASHMRYGCQIWGLCDNTNSHRILTLQKAALRLITFSAPRTPSNPIFSNLGILKFFDIVEVLNILFVHQYLNQNLPSDLLKTLKFIKISHSFNTRGNVLGLLQLPSVKTHNYGSNSFSKLAIQQWNDFQLNHSKLNISEFSFQRLKTLLHKSFLSSYDA